MKKKLFPIVLGVFMSIIAFSIQINSNSTGDGISLQSLVQFNIASAETNTVRFPVPKLCPSETKYQTTCSGSGAGCDPTDC